MSDLDWLEQRELAQCSDELGSTRTRLNDEMYAHEATRQRAEHLEEELRSRDDFIQQLREGYDELKKRAERVEAAALAMANGWDDIGLFVAIEDDYRMEALVTAVRAALAAAPGKEDLGD